MTTQVGETTYCIEEGARMGNSDGTSATTRILIVEDHFIMRRGLCDLLTQQPGFHVVAAVSNAQEALEVARQEPFDLAIIDISLGEVDGIELTARLKSEHSDLIVLVLSMHEEEVFAHRAAKAGASGFVAKQRAGDMLVPAIRCVLRGGYHFSNL